MLLRNLKSRKTTKISNISKKYTSSMDDKQDCYELKPLERGKRLNSCIRVNTRELDKELFTK